MSYVNPRHDSFSDYQPPKSLPKAPCIARVEYTDFFDAYLEGYADLHDLAWGQITNMGRRGYVEHELTVDNRGIRIELGSRARLVCGDRVWYGCLQDKVPVELRVWHDGSITEESD